ncbi:MAG: NAD(P)/FAD-dependent oxidoreductase [Rhizobiaceae bacterium]
MPVPSAVASTEILPSKLDVAIIGGGIAGIATALELAERGVQVGVFEKGIIAGEQSSRNWGWVRQMGRDPRELPLMQVSMQQWRQMHQRVGEDTGFRESGIAYLCEDKGRLFNRRQWYENNVGEYGLSSRMISTDEAKSLIPGSVQNWVGGLYTADDGRAEPTLAVPAMARAAQRLGTSVYQNCAVRALVRKAGKVCGLVTEHGEVNCNTVVLAGGAWSRRFCLNEGIELPQLSVINSVMRTDPLDAGISTSIAAKDFAIRKRQDEGYTIAHARLSVADITPDSFRLLRKFWPTLKEEWKDFHYRLSYRFLEEYHLPDAWNADQISPFENTRILNPSPSPAILRKAMAALTKALPVFTNAVIAEKWAGAIDVTPDAVPVISPVPEVTGLFMATGFSGHGFGLGPGAGKLMADLVCGDSPCVDTHPFRFDRF